MTTCSRPGCNKKLRTDNSTGECSSNCHSPEAPPAKRAAGAGVKVQVVVPERAPREKRTAGGGLSVAERFRMVFAGLGRDPEEMLAGFMEASLAEVEKALAAADAED